MITPIPGMCGALSRDQYLEKQVPACMLSHVRLFATAWTTAHQAPLSMRFPSQEHWSGLPFPPPGESSQPRGRTKHVLRCQGDSLSLSHLESPSMTEVLL